MMVVKPLLTSTLARLPAYEGHWLKQAVLWEPKGYRGVITTLQAKMSAFPLLNGCQLTSDDYKWTMLGVVFINLHFQSLVKLNCQMVN